MWQKVVAIFQRFRKVDT